MGEEEGERGGGGEMFCHHGKHPSNEQQSQISDFPPRRLLHWQAGGSSSIGLKTTESINSACERITLLEWRTGSFIIYIPLPSSLFCIPLLPFLFSMRVCT